MGKTEFTGWTFGFISGDKRRGLTQLGGLAKNKGVGPELGDGGAVETDVTHRLSEAAICEDVQHVRARPDCSDDAAERAHNMQTV